MDSQFVKNCFIICGVFLFIVIFCTWCNRRRRYRHIHYSPQPYPNIIYPHGYRY